MKFEYLKNLRGANGERFADEPADYRQPKKGEWFIGSHGGALEEGNGGNAAGMRLILRRLKTAREWLQELPDGWREEALANCENPDHEAASVNDSLYVLRYWDSLPSGEKSWQSVARAIENNTPIPPHPSISEHGCGGPHEACGVPGCAECGTPIPPHPSTVKPVPKIVRLPVVLDGNGWLVAGEYMLGDWLGRADFRGFVFVLPNGEEVAGLSATIIWRPEKDSHCGLYAQARTDYYRIPIRPSFMEVEQ